MGWDIPWFSSADSDFNIDFGVMSDDGETFGLRVFLRDGDDVYRTYFTSGRGVEVLGSEWTFLDLTPGGLGGLTRRLPPNPRVRVVAPP